MFYKPESVKEKLDVFVLISLLVSIALQQNVRKMNDKR